MIYQMGHLWYNGYAQYIKDGQSPTQRPNHALSLRQSFRSSALSDKTAIPDVSSHSWTIGGSRHRGLSEAWFSPQPTTYGLDFSGRCLEAVFCRLLFVSSSMESNQVSLEAFGQDSHLAACILTDDSRAEARSSVWTSPHRSSTLEADLPATQPFHLPADDRVKR